MDNYRGLVDLLIKAEMDGVPRHEQVLILGRTPDYLQRHVGFPGLALVTTGKVIGKAHFDHGVPASLLKRLPDVIGTPKSVFRPANRGHGDSAVVLTFELQAGFPVVVPIRRNVHLGRSNYANLVVSAYAKEGPDPEAKWRSDNLLIWEPES